MALGSERGWASEGSLGPGLVQSDADGASGQAARLSTLLERRTERIRLEDDVLYRRARVQLHFRGALIRDEKRGVDIGSKTQTVMRDGDLIISRIDARNGAMSIVPQELDGAVATGDFPVFRIHEKVQSIYLRFALFRPAMLAIYETLSKGSTNRRRLDVSDFLALTIPLPSPEVQARLAERFTQCEGLIQETGSWLEAIQLDLDSLLEAVLHDTFEPLETSAGPSSGGALPEIS